MSEPRVYYADDAVTLYHGDCREIAPAFRRAVVISDPPYNVGYHYRGYSDRLSVEAYDELLLATFRPSSVLLHYPEAIFRVARLLRREPDKCVAWVYNAHTRNQWRMLAWFGMQPDFTLVKQPYRNPSDKRVAWHIANGSDGASLSDWWNIEQVKNVSAEKTEHPCQIPTTVMERAIGVTPCELILDPFAGSGTTLIAARRLGRKAVGIELDEEYCEVAAKRLRETEPGRLFDTLPKAKPQSLLREESA